MLINGTENDDTLEGGDGDDTIYGFGGDDLIDGGGGDDIIDGGAGDDRAEFNYVGVDGLDVTITDDMVVEAGSGETDTLVSIESAEFIASNGDDMFDGTGATIDLDFVSFGLGEDSFLGGDGEDSLFLDFFVFGDDLDLVIDDDGIDETNSGTSTTLASIESASIYGGSGNDRLDASAAAMSLILGGGEGSDTVIGSDGDDLLVDDPFDAFVEGNDVLTGGGGDDTFMFNSLTGLSLAGDRITDLETGDRIDLDSLGLLEGIVFDFIGDAAFSGAGAEIRYEAGGGETEIEIDADGDGDADHRIVIENGAFDLEQVSPGSLLLRAEPSDGGGGGGGGGGGSSEPTEGNDNLRGDAGDNIIDGLGGNDVINGLAGDDELTGGLGDDRLFGRAGDDILDGGPGDDILRGNDGNDILLASSGDNILDGADGADSITGGDGNDLLLGRDGEDVLTGNAGNDNLKGMNGDDVIDGGEGRDFLNGAQGADLFVFDSVEDSTTDPANRDTILGFARGGGDLMDLSAIDADINTQEDDAFVIVDEFSGTAGELRYELTNTEITWKIQADVDGDGQADFELLVKANTMADDAFIL